MLKVKTKRKKEEDLNMKKCSTRKNENQSLKSHLTQSQAEILLAAVILLRSTSYLFSKGLLSELDSFQILSIRFLSAGVLLSPFLLKYRSKINLQCVLRGSLLGLLFFGVMAAEMNSLKTMPTSVTSFTENTAIVFVPLFHAAFSRQRLPMKSFLYAGIALAGVALLTLDQTIELFSPGTLWGFAAAILYALTILATKQFSKHSAPQVLGIVQVIALGIASAAASFLSEKTIFPEIDGTAWFSLLFLILICTVLGFTLQPLAQSGTTAERAGILCALNPAAAALLGHFFLNENLGVRGILGALLILACLFGDRK